MSPEARDDLHPTVETSAETVADFNRLVWVMAAACGISVANLYYNQPLLAQMAGSMNATPQGIGAIPTLTQAGYAIGLLLIVPMGDVVPRRRLISVLLVLVAAALAAAAVARNLRALAIASLAIGIATVVPQVLIPLAARLAPPGQRGRAVGVVMMGLLLGILLSRTLSGFVGDRLGWRAMYWIAAGMMLFLALALAPFIPAHERPPSLSYLQLLRSVWETVRREKVLRQAMLSGALIFACFSALWATLVFRLQTPPLHYGQKVAGLFGLVGAAGALVAPLVGRLSDRISPRTVITAAVLLMMLSFAVFWWVGATLLGLAVGVVLLDVAAQSNHVANQTRIYSLAADLHSRVNSAYMGAFFIGGAAGSLAATWAWSAFGWPGVCAVGIAFSFTALVTHLLWRRTAVETV